MSKGPSGRLGDGAAPSMLRFGAFLGVIKLMRVSVWSNFSDGSVLGWVGDKDIVYINEYKLMLVGAV